jgi:acyl dehydratase
MAAHAVLKAFCDYDAARIKSLSVRFTAPVYPGEKIRFSMWHRGQGIHLKARVDLRDSVVLNNGYIGLA